ncbi:MAG: histidine kinase [Bacteroidota bacterium]
MKALRICLVSTLILILLHSASEAQPVMSAIRMKIPSLAAGDTAKVYELTRNGFKYLSSKSSTFGIVKSYIDSALYICEREGIDIPGLMHLLMANYNLTTGDYLNASGEAELAMKKAEEDNDYMLLISTYFFLGNYYSRTGIYNESVNNFQYGIDLAAEKSIRGVIPKGYFGQANVYNSTGNLEEYEQTLQRMIAASYEEHDTMNILKGYYLYGTLKGERSWDHKLADSLLMRSYDLAVIVGDTATIARSLGNLGFSNYLARNYDLAISLYNKSLQYSKATSDLIMLANAFGNLGTIYRDLGNLDKSVINYKKGIELAKEAHDWYELYWIYRDMSLMYLKAGDTSNAYTNYVLYKQFSDSTILRNRNQWMNEASIRYKVDSQQKEVQLLSLRLKNQRTLSIAFGFLVPLTVALAFFMWRGSKLKDKRRISEMNRQIAEIQQANLRQQMNPHFIFNTLNSIQYYMYQHDKLATNNYLTKFSNLMRKVLENSQHTYIPLSDELNALTLYLELESIRFKDKFDFEIIVDEDIDPIVFKVPTMLIQPYVENSICHGLIPMETRGKVKIEIKLVNDYLTCTIEDNGIGRDAARGRRNERDGNHNSLGTKIVASRLDLVNSLYGSCLKTTYTDLKDPEGNPAGTKVEMQIPVMT